MLRSILAIIVSYAVMFIFFFVAFTGCYIALGANRVFRPDSYEVSALWIVLALVVSLLGAVLAGYVCAVISRNRRTCQVLAFIVFLLGLVACIPAMKRDPDSPNVRAGEVENLQAMQLAVTPMWVHLLTPVISAAGVLVGARLRRRGAAEGALV